MFEILFPNCHLYLITHYLASLLNHKHNSLKYIYYLLIYQTILRIVALFQSIEKSKLFFYELCLKHANKKNLNINFILFSLVNGILALHY